MRPELAAPFFKYYFISMLAFKFNRSKRLVDLTPQVEGGTNGKDKKISFAAAVVMLFGRCVFL